MPFFHAALTWIRNYSGSLPGRGPAFWAITLLVALLLPSPIAAPVLVARLRRATPEDARLRRPAGARPDARTS